MYTKLGGIFMSTKSTAISAAAKTSTAKAKANFKSLDWCYLKVTFLQVFKALGRIFAGAIILVVLASLAPELREQLPSFYRFIDCLMACIEWFYDKFWLVIDKF